MRSVKKLNKDIFNLTRVISEEYPELTIFLEEVPCEGMNIKNVFNSIKNLNNYHKTLDAILFKYAASQETKIDIDNLNTL